MEMICFNQFVFFYYMLDYDDLAFEYFVFTCPGKK